MLPYPADDYAPERERQMRIARYRLDWLLGRETREPSCYSLTTRQLARHIRSLRRQGWQGWEIAERFTWPVP